METALRKLLIDRDVIAAAYGYYETGEQSALLNYLESWAQALLYSQDCQETAKGIVQQTLDFATKNRLNVIAIHSITDVLFNGWEMDNYAWVIDLDDGSKLPFTSDHGRVCLFSRGALINKIAETSASLAGLVHLKQMLEVSNE